MDNSRRTFLKNSAALAALTALPTSQLFAQMEYGMLTGLQLYSVRDDMRKDPSGTLKQLSDMGYKFVEHAGYSDRKFYGYAASDFKKYLDDLGMKMPSGHSVLSMDHYDTSKKDFTDTWKYTLEDSATAGIEYVISPWLDQKLRSDLDTLKSFMDVFNQCGELCKTFGVKYGYHNHDFEFSQSLEGKTLFDHILDLTDPDLVAQQLDIGNMVNGGANAMDVLKKYPGRFVSLHVKDEIKAEGGEGYESCVLGTGIVGVKEVIDASKKMGGTKHFIIEQEAYQGKTPISCMKENIGIMEKWGY